MSGPTRFPFGVEVISALGDTDGPRIERVTGAPAGSLDRPPGSLALSTAGNLWLNISSGASGTEWILVGGAGNLLQETYPLPLAGDLANDTTNLYWSAPPEPITIEGFTLVGAGFTTGGTATLAIASGAAFGDNLLSSATVDLTAVSAGTNAPLALTGTSADLEVGANEQVRFQIVSNNADLAGGALALRISYSFRGF